MCPSEVEVEQYPNSCAAGCNQIAQCDRTVRLMVGIDHYFIALCIIVMMGVSNRAVAAGWTNSAAKGASSRGNYGARMG